MLARDGDAYVIIVNKIPALGLLSVNKPKAYHFALPKAKKR
jgi:hypothetical protein